MKKTNQDNNFKYSIYSYKEVLIEYYVLAQRPLLSELEAKRLEHILEMACQDDKLSLLLHEIDEAVFQKQNLDENKDTHEHQNQIARVLELIDDEIPSHKIIFEHAKLNLATYKQTISDYYRLLKLSSLSEANEAQLDQILEEAYNDELLSFLLEVVDGKFFERASFTKSVRQDMRQSLVDNQIKVSFQTELIITLSEKTRSSKIKAIGAKIRHRRSSLLRNVRSGLIACSLMLSAPCLVKLIYDVCILPMSMQLSVSGNLHNASLIYKKVKEFKPKIDLDTIDLPYVDFGGSENLEPNVNEPSWLAANTAPPSNVWAGEGAIYSPSLLPSNVAINGNDNFIEVSNFIEILNDDLTEKLGGQRMIPLALFNIDMSPSIETDPNEVSLLEELSNSGDLIVIGMLDSSTYSLDRIVNIDATGIEDLDDEDIFYSFPIEERLDIIIAGSDIATEDFVASAIVPFSEFAVGEAAESPESVVATAPTSEGSAESISLGAIEQINNYSQGSLQLDQGTNVSEQSGVRPSDWAFTALQRLVEEYGCIEGFPNHIYRGNQPMTWYEFAAGLNACLDVIIQLNGASITAEELATIRHLQEEFQSELVTFRGRVDALEADVVELEANQFSTTTNFAFLHATPDPDTEATNTFVGLLSLDFGRFKVAGYGAFHDQDSTDEEIFSWQAGISIPDFSFEKSTLVVDGVQTPDSDEDQPFFY